LELEQALVPQPLAQRLDQRGVLGPALGEDVAHPVQHRQRVGKAGGGQRLGAAFVSGNESGGLGARVQRRVGEHAVGQRADACLPGDHALGAALLTLKGR
jgi:hypothetical protein